MYTKNITAQKLAACLTLWEKTPTPLSPRGVKILEEQTANIDATDYQNVWSELEKKRRELETIIEYQTKRAILRSKSRWYNEGEKNTKYFLNLEKRHANKEQLPN